MKFNPMSKIRPIRSLKYAKIIALLLKMISPKIINKSSKRRENMKIYSQNKIQ